MIYLPAEDSYLLEKHIRKLARNKSILDMGSGSGIQAKAALASKASSVLAVDINPEAVNKLKYQNIPSIHSNLFQKIKGKFDLIAFNPPYLPKDKSKIEDKESELTTTGGKRGDEIIISFLKQAQNHLNKNGSILLILSSLTPRNKIIPLLKKLNLAYRILDAKKLFFETLELWEIRRK